MNRNRNLNKRAIMKYLSMNKIKLSISNGVDLLPDKDTSDIIKMLFNVLGSNDKNK